MHAKLAVHTGHAGANTADESREYSTLISGLGCQRTSHLTGSEWQGIADNTADKIVVKLL
jgi:hypothetical protein